MKGSTFVYHVLEAGNQGELDSATAFKTIFYKIAVCISRSSHCQRTQFHSSCIKLYRTAKFLNSLVLLVIVILFLNFIHLCPVFKAAKKPSLNREIRGALTELPMRKQKKSHQPIFPSPHSHAWSIADNDATLQIFSRVRLLHPFSVFLRPQHTAHLQPENSSYLKSSYIHP